MIEIGFGLIISGLKSNHRVVDEKGEFKMGAWEIKRCAAECVRALATCLS